MYRRVILIGAGLTGCQLLAITVLSEHSCVAMEDLAVSVDKMLRSAEVTRKEIEELQIRLQDIPPLAWPDHTEHRKEKKPKYVRQQHRLAMKYHSRK